MFVNKVHAALLRLQLRLVVAIMTVIITLTSFVKQRRMSHENGVTAKGRVRVVDNPTFPEHDFFQAGREWPCRIRHATVLFKDDAKMTVRGASLKFCLLYTSPSPRDS